MRIKIAGAAYHAREHLTLNTEAEVSASFFFIYLLRSLGSE